MLEAMITFARSPSKPQNVGKDEGIKRWMDHAFAYISIQDSKNRITR